MVIFCLKLQKVSENTKKTRRLSKEEIKQQLVDSIFNNNMVETEELNKMTEEVEKSEDAAAFKKKMKIFYELKRRTLYPSRIIKEKFSKDSRIRKIL